MFTSLRARLWLSYTFVIAVALGVVVIGLFVYLTQNPLMYRQAAAKLIVVDAAMLRNRGDWMNLSGDALQKQLEKIGRNLDVRILIFDQQHQLLVDSQAGTAGVLALPRLPRLRTASVVRDESGGAWLYSARQMETGAWLMLAVPRPHVSLQAIFRDEFFLPVIGAGMVALLLALLLAFLISRWVADPLQNLVTASRDFPAETTILEARGPREVQEVIGAFNAMTARVQVSTRSQQEFVANVSHELKTPLTSIHGFAQALLDGTADTPEAQQQAAGVIFGETARMHRMVLDLLELARFDAGILTLKREPVDLQALLQNVVARFALKARNAEIILSLQLPDLPMIQGDGDRLAQVFTNLVDNALKYSHPHQVVSISGAQTPEGVEITVNDEGAGIPPEAQAHIFDRFYQVDSSRVGGSQHGAGLGLAIVREIVLAHGGKISVRSASGQGSAFITTLPVSLPDVSTKARRKK